MTKQRIKVKLPVITDRNMAEQVMNEIALAETNKRKIAAKLDAEILKLKEQVAPLIEGCNNSITSRADMLKAWAEAHPEEFSRGKKSITFLSGVLGFRTGTPKLALLSRAWNWEKVLEAVKRLTEFSIFVRVKEEVDKEKILTQYPVGTELTAIGVKVVQDESFFIEPNLTISEPAKN